MAPFGRVGWLIVGVLIFAIPISLYSLATQGSLSYSGQSYLYAVYKDSDVLQKRLRPAATDSASSSSRRTSTSCPVAMLENARDYANLLLLRPRVAPAAVTGLDRGDAGAGAPGATRAGR